MASSEKKTISRNLGGFNLGFNQENLEKITRKWAFCAAGSVLNISRPLAQNGLKYQMAKPREHFDTKINKIRRSQPELLSREIV